ncbi:MAG: BatA domain-containing protein [Planctomycetales bacterium]|nr:BatA domain-containing protein [Planctomycetales bacterium]
MSFLFQSLLTVGLPLVAVPTVIHLINLRRRRKVEWAAMDFLLESQKRNKKWILLKQLLLLALRTLAIALVVLMLAGPVIPSDWGRLFGRGVTHHVLLVDDSYSMSDQRDQRSVFDEAKRVVLEILRQADGRAEQQLVTLLRFSDCRRLSAGDAAEWERRPLDAQLLAELESLLGKWRPSETDAGPSDALQAAQRLPEPQADETTIAYVVSDFRRPQWQEQAQLAQAAQRVSERVSQLRLIQCVEQLHDNLAVTRLAPESGPRAAGIETWMELAVANYGERAAAAVAVTVEQDGARLPAVVIDEIGPGEEVAQRFRATFADAGAHELAASLESDAVELDNVRRFALEAPASYPVLIIDGSVDRDDSYYLANALSPGGKNLGGWAPQIEPASFLRKYEQLARFAAIFLLDLPRIDEAEVAALEDYVRRGGGLAIFVGPQTGRDFFNRQLYRDGEGLAPAPLDVPTQLLRDAEPGVADVVVSDHPVFRVFAGQRNGFLPLATVDFFYALDPTWRAPLAGDVTTLAKLRNDAPLVMEKRLGEGRVIVQLTKLSPQPTQLGVWNNWSLNPVFPVLVNELVGYLSASRDAGEAHVSGLPLTLELPEEEFEPEFEVTPPRATAARSFAVAAETRDGRHVGELSKPADCGVWKVELRTRDGKEVLRYLAVNPPRGEGDLHFLDRTEIAERLPGVDYEFMQSSELGGDDEQLAGIRLQDSLLYALLAALVIEQGLAYAASYHAGGAGRAA